MISQVLIIVGKTRVENNSLRCEGMFLQRKKKNSIFLIHHPKRPSSYYRSYDEHCGCLATRRIIHQEASTHQIHDETIAWCTIIIYKYNYMLPCDSCIRVSFVQGATSLPATSSLYRLNSTYGATCILIRTDGLLSVQYRDKLNEDKEADTFLPDDPELFGDCTDADISSITLKFKGFVLKMVFKKTPGGERWYVSNVELQYSSSNTVFEHIDRPGLTVS